jgi:hypothetical protein
VARADILSKQVWADLKTIGSSQAQFEQLLNSFDKEK